MKKESIDLVKKVGAMAEEAREMSVDRINEMAPKAEEQPELRLTAKERAAKEGVRYIEPKKRFKGVGKPSDKFAKQRERAWEYVKGVYENRIVSGEPIEFWYNGNFPGEPDCLWNIPCNVPVYVPRFIAEHLEKCQVYHTFSALSSSQEPAPMRSQDVEAMRWFAPTGTHYRGQFRSIGAFN
jgi:hypothetical protein